MMRRQSLARSQLLARWQDSRRETDALFGIVRPEFLFERPIAERHRIAFYIGHLEAFEWNLFAERLGLESDRPHLDRLFAFGIDPIEGDLPSDKPADWPALAEFHAYRDNVRRRLDTALANNRRDEESDRELERRLNVAIEHRQMHAETLSYLFHQLPFGRKQAAPPTTRLDARKGSGASSPRSEARDRALPAVIDIAAGDTVLGLSSATAAFGWDNEHEAHTVAVPAFAIDRFKVSNAQYQRFVAAGGYADRALWSDADWQWRSAQRVEHPAFWIKSGDAWLWRSMFGAIALPADWPVYASHAEARAYATWTGRALPTEAQWQRAAFGENRPGRHRLSERTLREPALTDAFDPLPVDDVVLDVAAPFGAVGMLGNGWEWTSTPFAPFRGFHSFDFYPGYSEPFFDGKHIVLKGGSVRTAAPMLRPSFRNWFQSHYQFVYAGFRCVDRNTDHPQRSAT